MSAGGPIAGAPPPGTPGTPHLPSIEARARLEDAAAKLAEAEAEAVAAAGSTDSESESAGLAETYTADGSSVDGSSETPVDASAQVHLSARLGRARSDRAARRTEADAHAAREESEEGARLEEARGRLVAATSLLADAKAESTAAAQEET